MLNFEFFGNPCHCRPSEILFQIHINSTHDFKQYSFTMTFDKSICLNAPFQLKVKVVLGPKHKAQGAFVVNALIVKKASKLTASAS